MQTITPRVLLTGFLFVICASNSYAQNAVVTTSTQGVLIRRTPPLSEIDKNSMYGSPLVITRQGEGFARGTVDPERGEEEVFKNAKKSTDVVSNPTNGFSPSLNAPTSSINQNFDGQVFPNFAPSDNNMAVGPNHIIQIINHSSGSAFKIWNKSGGVVQNSVVLSSITGVTGSGDPVVLYDQLADRWVLTEFGKIGNINYINALIIAVSATSNPTGSWNVYSYNVGAFFVDYPKYAVWHNAYYATSNDFNTAGNSYLGSSIYAFDRNAMLSGAASATMIRTRFTGSGSRYYSMAPVSVEGPATSNQSGLFAFLQDNTWVGAPKDSIYVFEYTPNFASPASSVIGPFRAMATNIAFNTNTGALDQPGTTTNIQSLSQRIMNKVIYRNFGSSESIVCNTTDLAGTGTGVHWWELRRPGSGNWNIYQEGLWHPDNNNRFMGSIAINANGDIGLLYNVVSGTIYPSARFTGRSSCDPLGSMTLSEQVVMDGTTYEGNTRYGDYNSLSIDPVNGSFWGTAQYNATGGGTYGNWKTRIVNFTLTSSCGGGNNPGTVSGTTPLCISQTTTYTTNGDGGGTWSSTNTAVATVNASSGLVTAVTAGTANITYTIGGNSSFKTLTVNPNVSAGTVSGTSPVCIGATPTYSSNGTAGGTWSSNNTSVATVNASTGAVTAVGQGTTNITYTVNSGCGSPASNFKTLTVNPNVTAGTVSGTSPLCVGGTATYSSNGTAGGTWSSTNTSVATVNGSTGDVTAVGAGTTDITYTVNSGCGSPKSASKTLTVNNEPTPGTVSGSTPLCIGQTTTYTSDGTSGGTWSSSNTSVATVNSSSGFATAVGAGNTNIVYTVNACNGSPLTSSKNLIVNPNANAGTVSGTSPLCVGQSDTYTSNGDGGGSWSSSNTSVATVNSSGLVTALATGSTTIRYSVTNSCGTVTASQILTVNDVLNPGTVSGASSVCPGSSNTFTSDGNSGGTWSSDNTGVVTVNSSSGIVTGVSVGSANITYSLTNSCGPASASKSIDVVACPDPTITCPASVTTNTTSVCNKSISISNPSISNTTTLTWAMSGATTGSSSGSGINYVGTQTFNIGTTTITYTATNASGSANCSFTVTLTDNTSASISCPSNITNAQNGNNKCDATINVPNPNTSSNCSVTKLIWTMSGALSGSSSTSGINYVGTQTFPVGITTITYVVTNGANNTANCSFTVTVTNKKCPGSPNAPELTSAESLDGALKITVFPNPSETYFTLMIQTESKENVEVNIYNINGKLVQKLKGNASEIFRFGDNYIAGTYVVKVQQGSKQTTIKVVK